MKINKTALIAQVITFIFVLFLCYIFYNKGKNANQECQLKHVPKQDSIMLQFSSQISNHYKWMCLLYELDIEKMEQEQRMKEYDGVLISYKRLWIMYNDLHKSYYSRGVWGLAYNHKEFEDKLNSPVHQITLKALLKVPGQY